MKRRVIPTFLTITPERMGPIPRFDRRPGSELDLDIHTRSEIELHQRVNGLGSGVYDVEHTLACPNFKLLAALLVDMRAAQRGEFLKPGRQRDRTQNLGTGALRRVDDLAGRYVEHAVIEAFQPDANFLPLHFRPRACRPN